MSTTNGKPEIRLSLPSRFEYLFTLCGFFANVGTLCNFDEDASGALVTAVVEAATNAIQHGNGLDELKPVDIRVQILPDRLLVTVQDQGHGIPRELLGQPELPEDVFAVRGRGIALMKALMDQVEFDWGAAGTTVRLVKYRTPAS